MLNSIKAFIKKRKLILSIVAIILVIVIATIKIRANGTQETASPVVGDLVRTVKISGKIIPQQSVELGFETSGTVTSVSKHTGETVRRGEVLARIDTSNLSTNIMKAEAELSLAKAELDKLDGHGTYVASIERAKQALVQTIIDVNTAAEDAIYNKTDPFFSRPNSDRPDMLPSLKPDDSNLRNSINKGRVIIGETLNKWDKQISSLSASTYTETHLSDSRKNLAEVSSYIELVSRAASLFEANNAFPQATIDTYKADTIRARDNLNSATQNLIAAEDNLKKLFSDVPVQVARVEAARATVANLRSQLNKASLVSPIDGVVSRQDAKVGEVVSANSKVVSIISKTLQIEAFIPEVLVSEVRVGNTAQYSLDTYGKDKIYTAEVAQIDPAETIRDGVSTYKTLLTLILDTNHVRSGMSTNVIIETFRKDSVVLIPERSVLKEEGKTFVSIVDGSKSGKKTEVEIGERDSSGNVELLTHFDEPTQLILNPISK